jgi:hypothetical protein
MNVVMTFGVNWQLCLDITCGDDFNPSAANPLPNGTFDATHQLLVRALFCKVTELDSTDGNWSITLLTSGRID